MATTAYGTDVSELRQQLYEALLPAWKKKNDRLFQQDELEQLDCIARVKARDPEAFGAVFNQMIHMKIFKIMQTKDGNLAFKMRLEAEAEKYSKLTLQQQMVYEQIEESGGDGVWSKTIRTRLNMHESVVTQAVKHLISINYIKELNNVANTNRRMYIKTGVKQSERSTGGPWYTDGELDEPFVEEISNVLYKRIMDGSVKMSKLGRKKIDALLDKKQKKQDFDKKVDKARKAPLKGIVKGGVKAGTPTPTPAQALAIRDKAVSEVEMENYRHQQIYWQEFLPYPAGYRGFPKIDMLTEFVLDSGVCSEEVVLTALDIGLVLETMVLDRRIEEVDCGEEIGYKVTRQSLKPLQDAFNMFTEAPCGRCPVFSLCEEGGPVGPHNCEYFTEWLA